MQIELTNPRPWRVVADAIHPTAIATIFDDNSEPVLPYANGSGVLHPHTAALIVEAVNNYDEKKTKAESEKRHPDTEDEFNPTALGSYRRPWSVSIDDENCRAVIRDADGLEVAYISDVLRSRAGETAQMFADLAEERDRLRDIVRRLAGVMDEIHRICHIDEGPEADLVREARKALGEDKP